MPPHGSIFSKTRLVKICDRSRKKYWFILRLRTKYAFLVFFKAFFTGEGRLV